MNIWILFIASFSALAATSFVVMSLLWLRKLRIAVAAALGETAHQHIRSIQRLNDNIVQIQKQQHTLELRLQNLAKAHARLQKDFDDITNQIDAPDIEEPSEPQHTSGDRTIH